MIPRLTEIVVRVEDLRQEARFWEQGIGLPMLPPPSPEAAERVVRYDLGGPRLEIHRGGPPAGTPPSRREDVTGAPVIQVADFETALERALQHGGRQLFPVTSPAPNSQFTYVASPGGLVVGIVQGDEDAYRAHLKMPQLPAYPGS